MVIRTNVMGLYAWRGAMGHQSAIAKSIERLSSGSRINRAADDPSGMCMAQRMKMKLASLAAQKENVAMGMSELEIADGVMANTQNMLQDLAKLSAKAASGTITDAERQFLDDQFQQLLDEIDRNGQTSLYSRTIQVAVPAASGKGQAAPEATRGPVQELEGHSLESFLASLEGQVTKLGKELADQPPGQNRGETVRLSVGSWAQQQIQQLQGQRGRPGELGFTLAVEGGGIKVQVRGMGRAALGLEGQNLRTAESAGQAMDAVRRAISVASSQRAKLGADMNRLDHAVNQLDTLAENTQAALGRLTDADMAKEMMNLAKEQILAQAAQYMMAHTAQEPWDVLSLLSSMEPPKTAKIE